MALLKSIVHCSRSEIALLANGFKTSSAAYVDQVWRQRKGLTENPNAFGPLTNLPDYSFKDGRPVPYGINQKRKMIKNRQYAARIVQLVGEMDYAVERSERLKVEKEQEKQRILDSKLKPKGELLLQQKNDS